MFDTKQYRFFMEAEVYHGPDWLFSRCKRATSVEYQPKSPSWGDTLPEALDKYFQSKVEQYKNYYGVSGLVSMRFVDLKCGKTIREYNKSNQS